MIGLKLDDQRVMWLGGNAAEPADGRRTSIYDIRTRTFRETAPVPFAKSATDVAGHRAMLNGAAAGVLADGSVVIAGGEVTNRADRNAENVLSYRYDPTRDRWTRTGDLPQPQEWAGTATLLLRDGRLFAAGGWDVGAPVTGVGSLHAFVYDPWRWTTVDEVDPNTGQATGRGARVQGAWDYTRTEDGQESTLSEPHYFGNAVRLDDGRVLVGGGHTVWRWQTDDVSVLATHTEFFNPATGSWTQGPSLPVIPGEDDRVSGSHGGRTNGACFSTLGNNQVVIAGGNSATDGSSYFGTDIGRQSILVLTPARDPRNSRYQVSPSPIPSGTEFGGLLGDGGRNQLPCYAVSGERVVLAGGQSTVGEDLYDTYVFNPRTLTIGRGPDLVHGVARWAAAHPEYGYPANYQCAAISTRRVSMHSSLLVFADDVLVHGGGFDALINSDTSVGFPYVEQLGGA